VQKTVKIMDLAMKNGAPLVGLYDCGRVRSEACAGESMATLGGRREILISNVMASGLVPQLSALMGPCVGGASCSPAMTDFTLMVKGASQAFLTDPRATKVLTGEETTPEELGGAMTHATTSGVVHLAADDEGQCLQMIRELLSYLPQNNLEEPPRSGSGALALRAEEQPASYVAPDLDAPYDVRDLVRQVVDGGVLFEIQPQWARNLIVGFARLEGRSIGIVGNQPACLDGRLDKDSCVKAARFIRFCDAFNLPVVTFVDVPGFVPGAAQEHGGIIRDAAKLLYAYCEASVPKLTLITHKALGEAYEVMGSKGVRADFNFAWPAAEIRGAQPCEAGDPPSPYIAARLGLLDDVIEPAETRQRLISALEACASKREGRPPKKHGNIPL